jgi:hypothetical protein
LFFWFILWSFFLVPSFTTLGGAFINGVCQVSALCVKWPKCCLGTHFATKNLLFRLETTQSELRLVFKTKIIIYILKNRTWNWILDFICVEWELELEPRYISPKKKPKTRTDGYHNTFIILTIIKLFSINAVFFSKLVVHDTRSSRNYIVVYCTWLFCLFQV